MGSTKITDDLILNVTPPRVPRNLLARQRLMVKTNQLSEHPIILIEAPLGFGKTSLLAQWRREFQAEGAVIAWLSARQTDEPNRFIQSLTLAFRLGAGKPQFGQALLNAPVQEEIEGVAGWLAEISRTALNSIL